MFENLKKREQFFDLWKKRNEPENLGSQEKYIVKAMQEHEEYHQLWNSGDVYQALNFKTSEDPFFHVTIHAMLEKHIDEESPPEVKQAYNHLKNKGIPRHKILHSLGIILGDEIYEMMKQKRGFNVESYSDRMRKFLET